MSFRSLFLFITLLALVTFTTANSLQDPSTKTSEPFVCRNPNGRAARVGRCICFLVFRRRVRVKMGPRIRDTCNDLFGPRPDILGFRPFCRPFREGNNLDIDKVFRTTQRFIDICLPENPIMVMMKMFMQG